MFMCESLYVCALVCVRGGQRTTSSVGLCPPLVQSRVISWLCLPGHLANDIDPEDSPVSACWLQDYWEDRYIFRVPWVLVNLNSGPQMCVTITLTLSHIPAPPFSWRHISMFSALTKIHHCQNHNDIPFSFWVDKSLSYLCLWVISNEFFLICYDLRVKF